jgi:hypothetical protein
VIKTGTGHITPLSLDREFAGEKFASGNDWCIGRPRQGLIPPASEAPVKLQKRRLARDKITIEFTSI